MKPLQNFTTKQTNTDLILFEAMQEIVRAIRKEKQEQKLSKETIVTMTVPEEFFDICSEQTKWMAKLSGVGEIKLVKE